MAASETLTVEEFMPCPFEILSCGGRSAFLLSDAGQSAGRVNNHVSRVNNGQEAIEILRQTGDHAQAPRPDLIFLDLHMPRKNGRELLAEIKADSTLRRIPVIVLTSSSDQEDVNSVYDLHANCYLRKLADLDELSRQIRAIEEFWFEIVLWPNSAPVVCRR